MEPVRARATPFRSSTRSARERSGGRARRADRKAAKRLEEVSGRSGTTIHRLLGYDGKGFSRSKENPIDADVLVVDGFRWSTCRLAWHLFEAVDLSRTTVLLVDDHNQLPPVGPGNILRDLIQTRAIPTVILDKVVRQAGVLRTAPPFSGRSAQDQRGVGGRMPGLVSGGSVHRPDGGTLVPAGVVSGAARCPGFDIIRTCRC